MDCSDVEPFDIKMQLQGALWPYVMAGLEPGLKQPRFSEIGLWAQTAAQTFEDLRRICFALKVALCRVSFPRQRGVTQLTECEV